MKKEDAINNQIELIKMNEEENQRQKMLEGIKDMIESHHMFQTVSSVLQKKDLPERKKQQVLKEVDLDFDLTKVSKRISQKF